MEKNIVFKNGKLFGIIKKNAFLKIEVSPVRNGIKRLDK